MSEADERRSALSDPALPALRAMLGKDAAAMLEAGLPIACGRVRGARPTQVTWRPGTSLTVQYDATVEANGELRRTSLVALTGGKLPSGAAQVQRDGARVATWTVEGDPRLPALAAVLDPVRARRLLDAIEAPGGRIRPTLRAYRPGRRAVVELQGDAFRLFAKVVNPGRVAALQERHRLLREALPVPASYGWSAEHGLVLLHALPGETLREALARPNGALPAPVALIALLDRIPDVPGAAAAVSLPGAARAHAELLARLLPGESSRLDRLVAALPEGPPGDLVPVHGDFYEAQVTTTVDGNVAGMLDIDTAGPGYRIDDLANMLGHLAAWAPMAPDPARVAAYGRAFIAEADHLVPPAQLRRHVAAAILGLTTGPFRVQSANWPAETRDRIALAEQWMASADAIERR